MTLNFLAKPRARAIPWSALSHTKLRAHQELHSNITLDHINPDYTIHKNNNSFVEYTDAEAAKPDTTFLESTHNTLLHIQRGAQYWSELIEASGGY